MPIYLSVPNEGRVAVGEKLEKEKGLDHTRPH